MLALPTIKTFPLLKHYKRKTDDKKQVVIRIRISNSSTEKESLIKTIDIKLQSEDGNLVRATEAELKNRNVNEQLKYRIPEVETLIRKGIFQLIREKKDLTTYNIYNYTYHPVEFENISQDLIDNDDVQRFFKYPVPIAVWEEFISVKHTDEITGEPVQYEELEDIAHSIEGEYYSELRRDEVEKLDFNERYSRGEYDKNDIFECFGFCWSNHPTKNEPLITDAYRGLLMRLYDYRYNGNPSCLSKDFNDKWIKDFLMFLVEEGYSTAHIKGYTPFTLYKYKIKLITYERKAYKFGGFEKIVKHFKRYIFLLQKYKVIDYNRDTKFIDAKDFVKRNVNTTGYTRREHSLTMKEFKALSSKDFNDFKLNLARDMFIIAVLGGGFRGEEFYNGELTLEKRDNAYILHIYRSKTQTMETNPVFGELIEVIKRHNESLPVFMPYDEFRKSLRTIAEILEFNRIITSPDTSLDSKGTHIKQKLSDIFSGYFARKTFVAFLTSSGMVDEDIIEFTSHSKTDTLKHYKGNLSLSLKIKLLEKLKIIS